MPTTTQNRFTALQSGEVDILSRNTTWTMSRDTSLGLKFAGIMYYDGQGFMVPAKAGLKSAKQLKGATVCVQSGTTTEKNLTDFSRANKLDIKPVVFEKLDAANAAYFRTMAPFVRKHRTGLHGVALSLPAVIDNAGVREHLAVPLDPHEVELLHASAATIRTSIERILE